MIENFESVKLPEPPKSEAPTFKDVFLEAFSKIEASHLAMVIKCCAIFPWLLDENYCCHRDMGCAECWNQFYFEKKEAGK